MSMVSGSFASAPEEISKLGILHYQTKIANLNQYYVVKSGDSVDMSAKSEEKVAGCWDQIPNKIIYFDVLDNKGVPIQGQNYLELSTFWTATLLSRSILTIISTMAGI